MLISQLNHVSMLNRKLTYRSAYYFKHWSRKGYAVLASLSTIVHISQLKTEISQRLASKSINDPVDQNNIRLVTEGNIETGKLNYPEVSNLLHWSLLLSWMTWIGFLNEIFKGSRNEERLTSQNPSSIVYHIILSSTPFLLLSRAFHFSISYNILNFLSEYEKVITHRGLAMPLFEWSFTK